MTTVTPHHTSADFKPSIRKAFRNISDLHLESPRSIGDVLRDLRRVRGNDPAYGLEYPITGSGISSYEQFFRPVTESNAGIEKMVRGMPTQVVIDLMADSTAIASLFRQAGVQNGIGVAVKYGPVPSIEHDAITNITTVTGDLARWSTWRDIRDVLNGRSANLIMERAFAGLYNLPKHRMFFGAALNAAWHLLNPDGGTMLLQTLRQHHMAHAGLSLDVLESWARLLAKNNIEVMIESPNSSSKRSRAVRLTRHPDSPNELPLLPTK